MEVFTLPMRNDLPWYEFKVDLTDVIYTLTVRYNSRMGRWLMDLKDASGTAIVAGVPLLIEVDLFSRFGRAALPAGIIVPIDDTLDQVDPVRNSFGNTHSVLYVDP